MSKAMRSILESIENVRAMASAIRTIESDGGNGREKALQSKVDWALLLSKEIEKEARHAHDLIRTELSAAERPAPAPRSRAK